METPQSGQGQKADEQEVTFSVQEEADRTQDKLEDAETQPASLDQLTQPENEQKNLGGKKVAENNREGAFDSFNKINESVFSMDGVKKAAAWYIETGEKLANQAIELQERATGWAKDTPFAPLFEAQNSFARKFVERSVNAARTLWQIQH